MSDLWWNECDHQGRWEAVILNTRAVLSGFWRKHINWMHPEESVWSTVFFLVYLSSLLFPLPSFFLLFLALRFCWIVLRFFGLGLSEAVFLSSPSRSPTWDNFLTSVYLVITSVSHCNRLKLLLYVCLFGMGDLLFPTGLLRALLFPTGLYLQSLFSNF